MEENEINISREFLGAGWGFDRDISFGDGEIRLAEHEEDVHQAITIILGTIPGERVMRPDFGCEIHSLVFEQNNTGTAGLAQFYVVEALTQWEPRIDLLEVEVHVNPVNSAELLIGIEYVIKETDSRFNVVYPFYLSRGNVA